MVASNNLSPGMIILISSKLYLVVSSVKVTVAKGTPFIKTKLQEITTNKAIEKNFKLDQNVEDVTLEKRQLEYLYPEGKNHVLFDTDELEIIQVTGKVIGERINFIKEGTELFGSFHGEKVLAIELPPFLELMVAEVEGTEKSEDVLSEEMKDALLETGAKVKVPSFVGIGDVIKVDTKTNEYVQRV